MHEDCEGIILGIQSVKSQHAFVSTMLKCRMYKSNLSDRPSAAGTPFNEDRSYVRLLSSPLSSRDTCR